MSLHLYTKNKAAWLAKKLEIEIPTHPLTYRCVDHVIAVPDRAELVAADNPKHTLITDFRPWLGSPPLGLFNFKHARKHPLPSVVYAGVLPETLDSFLQFSFTRIWYYLEHKDTHLIFFQRNDDTFFYQDFFDLLGLPPSSYTIVRRLTHFDQVIIPEETLNPKHLAIHERFIEPFTIIRNHLTKQRDAETVTKLYIPDEAIDSSSYLANFYADHDFDVLNLVEFPLKSYLPIFAQAEKIACHMGTFSHLALIAQDSVTLDLFCPINTISIFDLMVNELRGQETNIIELDRIPIFFSIPRFSPTESSPSARQENAKSLPKGVDLLASMTQAKLKTDALCSQLQNLLKNQKNTIIALATRRDQTSSVMSSHLPIEIKDSAITALKIISSHELMVAIYHEDIGWQEKSSHDPTILGDPVSQKPIQALAIRLANNTEHRSVRYRAFLKNKGWTRIHSDGEILGSKTPSRKKRIAILALHIFFEEIHPKTLR